MSYAGPAFSSSLPSSDLISAYPVTSAIAPRGRPLDLDLLLRPGHGQCVEVGLAAVVPNHRDLHRQGSFRLVGVGRGLGSADAGYLRHQVDVLSVHGLSLTSTRPTSIEHAFDLPLG